MSAFHGPQPGVKNHGNKGALRDLRDVKRREAEIRQERYRNDHPSPAEQMKRLEEIYEVEAEVEDEMKNITTDPGIVAALNKNEDDTESKPHRRRKRTVTRKHKADE